MYWILLVMAAIAAIVIALVVGGLVTAETNLEVREIVLRATPDLIWPVMYDVQGATSWCEGLPTMEVVTWNAPHLMTTRLLDDSGDEFGTWLVALTRIEGGTRLIVAETVTIGNPVVRFVRQFGGRTARVDRWLVGVAEQLDEFGVVVREVTGYVPPPPAAPPGVSGTAL
jgi:hypothetical protein